GSWRLHSYRSSKSSSTTPSSKPRGISVSPHGGDGVPAFIGELHVPTRTHTQCPLLLQLGRARRGKGLGRLLSPPCRSGHRRGSHPVPRRRRRAEAHSPRVVFALQGNAAQEQSASGPHEAHPNLHAQDIGRPATRPGEQHATAAASSGP